jgi:serine/threonine-protein kinase
LLIALALAAAGLAHMRSGSQISVPGFIGLDKAAALTSAKQAGLTDVTFGAPEHAPDPAGQVIAQDPASGTFTGGHHVTLVLSAGPAKVPVPSIVGQQWETQAKPALDGAGLMYDAPGHRYDEKHAKGVVLSVTPPAGVGVLPDTQKVTVVISDGHAPVKIPNVANKAVGAATKALQKAHFKVKRAKDANSDSVPAGNVISVTPGAGAAAPYGSTVTVTVSKGPVMVTVPDVTGDKLSQAIDALNKAGLAFDAGRKARSTDIVIAQDPVGGASVPQNSTTVTLTLHRKGA